LLIILPPEWSYLAIQEIIAIEALKIKKPIHIFEQAFYRLPIFSPPCCEVGIICFFEGRTPYYPEKRMGFLIYLKASKTGI
jgi:hypothetical protein